MQTSRGPLTLLVDPSFRCGVALVHSDRLAGMELRWADDSRSWVSHDPSFDPAMTPCELRMALAQAAVGASQPWLGDIVGWNVGGPFVDPLGGGVLGHGDREQRTCWFATTIAPVGVQQLGAAIELASNGTDPIVSVSMDPAVGVSCVRVDGAQQGAVDEAAKLLASACRHRERVLRLAGRSPSH